MRKTTLKSPEPLELGDSISDGSLQDNGSKKTVRMEPGVGVVTESAGELEGQVVGRFRLEQEIARGGMGIIFRSHDLDLDREVAVKLLLKRHLGKAAFLRQFTNEAKITGRLQHPGIVPIYETGVAFADRPYFAMKLIRGKTLAEHLSSRKSPDDDLPRMLKIFEQVCQTLSYIHVRGIIHLDIKPANVMVGEFGEVHLMDWGLARAADGLCIDSGASPGLGETESGVPSSAEPMLNISSDDEVVELPVGPVWGTPAYMSPEQACGNGLDVRSDVFGLGGILCEILAGCPPYVGKGFLDVCFKAGQADLNSAYTKLVDSGADKRLVRLAMKCLSRDPEDRPVDARIVAGELTMFLESRLQSAESDLVRFFELSLDLFCIAGLDGYFRRVNSNFPRVLGYSERELVSRPFMEFVHPEDRDETVEVMSQLKRGQPVVRFENRYRAADGSWRRLEWTAKSVPADEIIFAVARDVTNQGG
jgi:PAS domain S-box-containing protein